MEEYDENDAEYFGFIQHRPLLDTIYESSSFHSDHDHHSQHRHHPPHFHNHHHHHKTLQLIKFLSLWILQYAVVSLLFQFQVNLRHPPSALPSESYQVDNDDDMHQSFVPQTRSANPNRRVAMFARISGDDKKKANAQANARSNSTSETKVLVVPVMQKVSKIRKN